MISVPNLDILNELPTGHLKNGELAEIEDGKRYVYDGETETWKPCDGASVQISLYDLNKQFMKQQPAMEDIDKQKDIIHNFVARNKENKKGNYYMLLCNELRYFTLFERPWIEDYPVDGKIKNLVLECVNDIGVVHDMMMTDDESAIEIWVETNAGDMYAMLFFLYDNGIVYFGD